MKYLIKVLKKILRKECNHTWAYFNSFGIKRCIDCDTTELITNIIKHQR